MYIDVFRRNCHIFKLRCTNCFRVSLCFNIKLNLSHLLWNIISLKRDLFGFNSQTRHTLSNFPVYSRVMGVFISLISVVMLFFDSLIFFFVDIATQSRIQRILSEKYSTSLARPNRKNLFLVPLKFSFQIIIRIISIKSRLLFSELKKIRNWKKRKKTTRCYNLRLIYIISLVVKQNKKLL